MSLSIKFQAKGTEFKLPDGSKAKLPADRYTVWLDSLTTPEAETQISAAIIGAPWATEAIKSGATVAVRKSNPPVMLPSNDDA